MAEPAEQISDDTEQEDFERDMDSLHAMPLSIIPLETPALARARLVKNNRLESVIELFNEAATGSGQLAIDDLPKIFGWSQTPEHTDMKVIQKLGTLASYDVYSLRISLRNLGIEVNEHASLKLSKTKERELNEYMTQFTRPLIAQVFSDEDASIRTIDDLMALFRDPDVSTALRNLEIMAQKLELDLKDVPVFLEDYGDIFLSLSFYRQCLDEISPTISEFIDSLSLLRNNFQLRHDPNLMKTCDYIEDKINELTASVTGRFESMDRNSRDLWDNLSAERFRKVEAMIRSYHSSTGAILCGLTVKMMAWKRAFPTREHMSPGRFSSFLMSEVKAGLENIRRIENAAPMLADF